MHIVDITMFHAPQSGGVRTYLKAKRRALRALPGVRHSLLVPGAVAATQDDIHTLPAPAIPFGHGYRFPVWTRSWSARLQQLAPDIIEAGDPYRLAWAALDAGQALDVPVAAFYHSDLPRLVQARFGRAAGQLAARYVRRLYSQCDLVLAPSRIMAERLEGLGVARVAVQPLGVDVQRFHPRFRADGMRRTLGLPDDTRLLIFAGRAAREKNIPLLLETLRRLGPRYHLQLIGPGMPVRDVPRNVTVHPHYLEGSQLAVRLASADALIHAGDHETFGLVVLEAMASGLPVIGTAFGAVAEHVDTDVGVLANRVSVGALAGAVEALFERDHRALGRRARALVEERWSWERVFQQLLAHYAGVVKPARPAALSPAHAAH